MSEKKFSDRLSRMVKILPQEQQPEGGNSWCDETKKVLSTEGKIHAIKMSERGDLSRHAMVQKKRSPLTVVLRKWIKNCKWKVPMAILVFSVVQLFFYLIGPLDIAYQTLAFSPSRKLELWRFLTYALLHSDVIHLVTNLVLQLVLATPLETEVGSLSTVSVYVGGVLSGSLAASVSSDPSLMVGASSAVYGLLLSHVAHIYMNFSSISHRFYRIIFIVVMLLSDVVYSAVHCLVHGNIEPKIHIPAHVAGALSGFLLGFICFEGHWKDGEEEIKIKFKIIKQLSAAFYLSFVVAVIILNVL